MTDKTIQPENTVIIARDLGESLEIILKTDDFTQACLTFLDEWRKDRRVCMVHYVPSLAIAACAQRGYLEIQAKMQERLSK